MSATARDFARSDPWQSIAHRSHAMIARDIIGGVIGASPSFWCSPSPPPDTP